MELYYVSSLESLIKYRNLGLSHPELKPRQAKQMSRAYLSVLAVTVGSSLLQLETTGKSQFQIWNWYLPPCLCFYHDESDNFPFIFRYELVTTRQSSMTLDFTLPPVCSPFTCSVAIYDESTVYSYRDVKKPDSRMLWLMADVCTCHCDLSSSLLRPWSRLGMAS